MCFKHCRFPARSEIFRCRQQNRFGFETFHWLVNCPRRLFLQNGGYKRLVTITWYKHRQYVRGRQRIAGARRICISIITIIKRFVLVRNSGRILKSCEKTRQLSWCLTRISRSPWTLALIFIAILETRQIFSFCYLRITDYRVCGSEWSRKENIQEFHKGKPCCVTNIIKAVEQ